MPRRSRKIGLVAALLGALVWPAAAGAYQDLVVSPDGKNVYATGDWNLYSTGTGLTATYKRDPETGRLTSTGDAAPGGARMAQSPNGRWLFVARTDRFSSADALDVLERDPASGLLTLQWRIAEGRYGTIAKPRGLAVSPDGRQLYVSQAGPNAVVTYDVDPDTGRLTRLQSFARTDVGERGDIAMAPDGGNVYVAPNGDNDEIVAFSRNASTGKLAKLTDYPAQIGYYGDPGSSLTMAPDGKRLYMGSWDYGIWDRDPDTGALTFISTANMGWLEDDYGQHCDRVLATSPDGKSVFSTIGSIGWKTISLRQAAVGDTGVALERSYAESKDLTGLMLPSRVRWSADGAYAYLAGMRHVPGYDSGGAPGIAVLTWDQSTRTLGQREFDDAKGPKLPRGGHPALTINDGALYTNDPDVTISLTPPDYTASFRLAGTTLGLESGRARRVDPDGTYHWRLDTASAAPRDVRHAYVRLWTLWGDEPVELSDDIVLDQTAPTVTSARMKRGKLSVRAQDNRSGIRRIQVTRDRSKPGDRLAFAKHIVAPPGTGKVWVRVFDGAHNRSHWRRARPKQD
jgi:DNA-binding beta-propeller fold protein YncE